MARGRTEIFKRSWSGWFTTRTDIDSLSLVYTTTAENIFRLEEISVLSSDDESELRRTVYKQSSVDLPSAPGL